MSIPEPKARWRCATCGNDVRDSTYYTDPRKGLPEHSDCRKAREVQAAICAWLRMLPPDEWMPSNVADAIERRGIGLPPNAPCSDSAKVDHG